MISHSTPTGVIMEDIPKMKELGYKVQFNPSRPGKAYLHIHDKDLERFAVNVLKALKSKKLK
jgi:hypothetical protein